MNTDSRQSQDAVAPYPVKFYAIPMERVWGGHSLKTMFASRCAGETPSGNVGEYWVLSGHPNGTSVVSNGPFQGMNLVELTEAYPSEYLGDSPQPRFPLLIKFLEASEDLSVQVHPSDEMAQAVEGDFGKTEAWYVLECEEDGRVVYGHNFTSREELTNAFSSGTIRDYLSYRDIQPGDTVFVPSQTLHALLAGTKVIEVQQTSDVTYRVYDWDRVGTDGKPRELHVDKAAEVLFGAGGLEALSGRVDADPRSPLGNEGGASRVLVTCPYFTMYELSLEEGGSTTLQRQGARTPDVLIGVEGEGLLTWGRDGQLPLGPGDTCLIPTSLENVRIEPVSGSKGPLRLLVARY